MARFKVEMQDSYDILGEKIVISTGGPRGYVFVDVTAAPRGSDKEVTVRLGFKGKRLTKFIKALRHAEVS